MKMNLEDIYKVISDLKHMADIIITWQFLKVKGDTGGFSAAILPTKAARRAKMGTSNCIFRSTLIFEKHLQILAFKYLLGTIIYFCACARIFCGRGCCNIILDSIIVFRT